MSIFVIILLALLIGVLVALIYGFVYVLIDDYMDHFRINLVIMCCIGLAIAIAGIFIGIGLTTENERIYINKYEAQKETIETSLESDVLTGFERAQLVNQAATLNGELAERKAKFDRWHFVTYDSSMYDSVEPINIK